MHARFQMSIASTLMLLMATAALAGPPITCYSDTYPPYVIANGDTLSGIDVDVIREVARRTDTEVTIKLSPWKRLELDLSVGRVDCVFSYFRAAEREAFAAYSQVPLHVTDYTLFIREDDKNLFPNLSAMHSRRFGVRLGFKTTPEFETLLNQGKIKTEELADDLQGLKMLQLSRVDAVLVNADVGHYLLQQNQLDGIVAQAKPLRSTPAYLVVRRDEALVRWLDDYNRELFEMLIDGSYQAIRQRYRHR